MDEETEKIYAAIQKYYSDTSRPVATTLENMEALAEEIGTLIEILSNEN